MPQPIDKLSRENYVTSNFTNIKKLHSGNQRIDCPNCNAKESFTINTSDPGFPYKCHGSCGRTGNIFTTENIGLPKFTDTGYSTGRQSGLPEIEYLKSNYYKKTGKNHRLSQAVIDHFEIKPFIYKSNDKKKEYSALSIFGSDDKPIKRLISQKWIGIDERIRSKQLWYGQSLLKGKDKRVYVCAGEWDLFTFWEKMGIDAIAWPNGEGRRRWLAEELGVFGQNKQIIILYDNDKVGREGAVSLASAIARFIKRDWVKIIDFAALGLFGGQDLDDFFNIGGGTKERLLQEIDDTKPVDISVSEHSDSKPNPLPFPNGSYVFPKNTMQNVWAAAAHTKARRDFEIKNIAFQLTGQTQGKEFIEERIRINNEIDALRYRACIELVFKNFNDKNIVRRKSLLGDVGFNLLHYNNGVYNLCDENFFEIIADKILKQVFPPDKIKSRKNDRDAILEEMRIMTNYQDEKEFDKDLNYINFKNGLFNLKTNELEEHRKDHYSTFQIKTIFEKSECPNFMQALTLWFDEPSAREFVKTIYYFLTGKRSEEVAILLRGPGNDGKSKSLEIFKTLAGPGSTSAIALNELTGHTLASLDGSFLNVVEDHSDVRFDSGAFKKVVSGGLTQINQKNKPVYSITPKALFVIASNYPVRTNDTSRGYVRRWKIIEYKEIKQHRQIKDFFNKRLKSELPGICYHSIIDGSKYWKNDNGFKSTEIETFEKSEMKSNSSPDAYFINVLQIIEDAGLDDKKSSTEIYKEDFIDIIDKDHYKRYTEFCELEGVRSTSHKKYTQHAQRFFNEHINDMISDGSATIARERRRIKDVFGNESRKYVLAVKLPEGFSLPGLVKKNYEIPF